MASGPASSSVSFVMDTQPFSKLKVEMERTAKAATLYALRETGRRIIESAQGTVPEYPGPQNKSAYVDKRVKKGLLRRSIHNSKVIENSGGSFLLKVGPMGPVTRGKGKGARGAVLYAQQVERMYGYMSKAVRSTDLTKVYSDAISVGYAKYR